MTRVALLGLGAMGRRMARRLVAGGHELTVWNRSGVSADASDLRALYRATPREAVKGVDVAIAMLTDDTASERVWLDSGDGAIAGLNTNALAIESSTLSPDWTRKLAVHIEAAGARFLDAPVVGSRPQAEAGALVYLVGGHAEDFARAQPLLAAMGSASHHIGATPAGSLAKLAVNALFAVQVAMLGELLGAARRTALDVATLMDVLGTLTVLSPAAKVAGAAICAERFDPLFPIALVAKDLRYAVASAAAVGASTPLTKLSAELFEQAARDGFSAENITAIAKLYRP